MRVHERRVKKQSNLSHISSVAVYNLPYKKVF